MTKKDTKSAADKAADQAFEDHITQTRREASGGVYRGPNDTKVTDAVPVVVVDRDDTTNMPVIQSKDWPTPPNTAMDRKSKDEPPAETKAAATTKAPTASVESKHDAPDNH